MVPARAVNPFSCKKMTMKNILSIHSTKQAQVGDGFPIRRAFPGQGVPAFDPFLVLDHAGPVEVPPSDTPKGVDEHPHRGFETVSIVYSGALEHRDSAGNAGQLFTGDVQWMTAASGLVHEEKHERAFTRQGGILEMVQLWVNLPARHKMDPPSYQDLRSADIPVLHLGQGAQMRLIAGTYAGQRGPARTHTALLMGDLRLEAKAEVEIALPEGWSTALYLLDGELTLNGEVAFTGGNLAALSPAGTALRLQAHGASKALLLSGEPIGEPVASYGPFVMNTRAELQQAFADYQSGKMGRLTS